MNFKLLFAFVFLIFITQIKPYEKQQDGIILKLDKKNETNPTLLRIQICTDDIIRVVAVKGNSFSERQSLMVSKTKWEAVKWSSDETGDEILLTTQRLKIVVNKESGKINFYNSEGQLILEEKATDGKIIKDAEVFSEKTFHIQTVFNSPADEAFYGLGEHQNNIMNYKGKDVDLWQYNIVDVVPFLVSSKNYGILWDNNSRTKFGDIRDYASISGLKLFDKDGKEGGLTAEYFSDQKFSSPVISRIESDLTYNSSWDMKNLPTGLNLGRASARYTGEFASSESGIHKIRLYSSGYTKLWIDDSLYVDAFRQGWLPWTNFIYLPLNAGEKHKIKIEWVPAMGEAFLGLKYLTPEDKNLKDELSLWSEVADQIDYYFIYGNNLDQVIHGYREITGKAPMMPKWAMGFWQCRERYKTQEELLGVVKEFRKRNIPIDNIVQDWFYWPEDKWGDHDFDLARFPDAEAMVKELHNDLHTHIMISVWPKFYVGTKNYDEFKKNGWLYMRNIEKQQRDWVGRGYVSTFYDVNSDGARKLFWSQVNNKLFSKGFDAWWLDATEPDIQSNLPDDERILRNGPTALGSFSRYANTFSIMNAKGIYEGQRQTDPNKRVFILTRSAFAGQQRYSAATWSGDIATRWYDMKAQITAGLNFNLSGTPYWTMDIGGFAVEPRYENPTEQDLEEWRELNTRWFQFGTFAPLFRVHGQFPYREVFYVAPEDHIAYKTQVEYNKLRYRLMPYIYSLTGMVTQNDYTIMRALVMDFGKDKNVLSIGNQFMFGPALLINPVTEYKARSRQLYLPSGQGWYDLKTNEYIEGGQNISAAAPYSDIPIYVKEGSIIPFGPEIQYTDEKPADPILLYVYTGKDAAFNLYEDENTNYNYEKGAFSIIPFTYSEATKTLTIGERKGEFSGMLKERTINVVFVSKDKKPGLNFNVKPDAAIKYNGIRISVVVN